MSATVPRRANQPAPADAGLVGSWWSRRSEVDGPVLRRELVGVVAADRPSHAQQPLDLAAGGLPPLGALGMHLDQRDAWGVEPVGEPHLEHLGVELLGLRPVMDDLRAARDRGPLAGLVVG